jgi:nucleotide-binding universal stress UspA family protein
MPKRVTKPGSMRRILVPLDGSRVSESALETLPWLALSRDLEILLLRVVQPVKPVRLLRDADPAAQTAFAHEKAGAEQYLGRVARRLARRGTAIRTLVREGDPAALIVDTARTHDASLIAMSTHGRTGLGRVLLGSVAEGVLRRAEVPVLIAPASRPRAAATRRGRVRRAGPP